MKQFDIEAIGPIRIYKRRANRRIRLSFDSDGTPRVSLPASVPYRAGLSFARSKQDWISRNRPSAPTPLINGQPILGKFYLVFLASPGSKRSSSRVKANQIMVYYPSRLSVDNEEVQAAARRGALKALKLAAVEYLPRRLAELAKVHGYKYSAVTIKPMTRRWGSCDSRGRITLNLFLIKLAPELIDYVLIHELVHTENPHHQAAFWQAMELALPEAKNLRRLIRAATPTI